MNTVTLKQGQELFIMDPEGKVAILRIVASRASIYVSHWKRPQKKRKK